MINHLDHLEEFNKLLADYHASAEGLELVQDAPLVLLTAPSAVGRNTIIEELLKTDAYAYLISDTTRAPRKNKGVLEVDGTVYWFRDEEDVLADVKAGRFLEAAVIHEQQVSGISIRELEKAHARRKIALTDVTVKGVHTIVTAKPDTIALFVLPPSFDEWQARFVSRGADEPMSPVEVKRRMTSAVEEFAAALEHSYYHFILNDTIPHAVEQVHNWATGQPSNPREQEVLRTLAEQLYTETVAYLATL